MIVGARWRGAAVAPPRAVAESTIPHIAMGVKRAICRPIRSAQTVKPARLTSAMMNEAEAASELIVRTWFHAVQVER